MIEARNVRTAENPASMRERYRSFRANERILVREKDTCYDYFRAKDVICNARKSSRIATLLLARRIRISLSRRDRVRIDSTVRARLSIYLRDGDETFPMLSILWLKGSVSGLVRNSSSGAIG